MEDHKFKAGQVVRVSERARAGPVRAKYGLAPQDKFEIVRLLPPNHGQNQYRIKSQLDGHERVVLESEIA